MTATAGEEEVLDQELTTSESNDTEDSQNDDVSSTSDEGKKNSSNWKKMSEAKKQAEYEAKEARKEAESLKAELEQLKEWANSLYTDESQKPFTKKEEAKIDDKADKLETKIFLLENSEAKTHIEEIMAVKSKFPGMELEDAWTFVKSKLPVESVSKKDFDTTTKAARLPKDLTKVSAEEALELSKEDRAKWRKANGWEY